MMMQSYFMNTATEPARLELRTVAAPEPGPGQMLLRVHAAGLNRGEFIVGHGLTKAGTAKPIGLDGAGVVVKAGAGVTRFSQGARVMGRLAGALSEYALVNEFEAMAIPPHLSWAEAAAVPITYMVAHDMLMTQGHLAAGESLLVTGVSSGVGVAALQIGKALGAKVIGTSGSLAKLATLSSLGLDVALCTRTADFYDDVMRETAGAGVDLVVNTVGGSVFAECVRSLAFKGRLATVGYVDGVLDANIDLQALHAKRLTLFGVSNKLVDEQHRAAAAARFEAEVLPMLSDGRLRPLVDQVFGFDQLEAAKAHMESNAHLGKIIIAVPGSTISEETS